jgi:hypothetical protein
VYGDGSFDALISNLNEVKFSAESETRDEFLAELVDVERSLLFVLVAYNDSFHYPNAFDIHSTGSSKGCFAGHNVFQ